MSPSKQSRVQLSENIEVGRVLFLQSYNEIWTKGNQLRDRVRHAYQRLCPRFSAAWDSPLREKQLDNPVIPDVYGHFVVVLGVYTPCWSRGQRILRFSTITSDPEVRVPYKWERQKSLIHTRRLCTRVSSACRRPDCPLLHLTRNISGPIVKDPRLTSDLKGENEDQEKQEYSYIGLRTFELPQVFFHHTWDQTPEKEVPIYLTDDSWLKLSSELTMDEQEKLHVYGTREDTSELAQMPPLSPIPNASSTPSPLQLHTSDSASPSDQASSSCLRRSLTCPIRISRSRARMTPTSQASPNISPSSPTSLADTDTSPIDSPVSPDERQVVYDATFPLLEKTSRNRSNTFHSENTQGCPFKAIRGWFSGMKRSLGSQKSSEKPEADHDNARDLPSPQVPGQWRESWV